MEVPHKCGLSCVTGTGRGIPEDKQQFLFRQFGQVDKDSHNGLGFGSCPHMLAKG